MDGLIGEQDNDYRSSQSLEANTTFFECVLNKNVAAETIYVECLAMYEQDLIVANGVLSNTNKISFQPTGNPV